MLGGKKGIKSGPARAALTLFIALAVGAACFAAVSTGSVSGPVATHDSRFVSQVNAASNQYSVSSKGSGKVKGVHTGRGNKHGSHSGTTTTTTTGVGVTTTSSATGSGSALATASSASGTTTGTSCAQRFPVGTRNAVDYRNATGLSGSNLAETDDIFVAPCDVTVQPDGKWSFNSYCNLQTPCASYAWVKTEIAAATAGKKPTTIQIDPSTPSPMKFAVPGLQDRRIKMQFNARGIALLKSAGSLTARLYIKTMVNGHMHTGRSLVHFRYLAD